MVKSIPLSCGKFALVDDEDYPLLSRHKWCLSDPRRSKPYAVTSLPMADGGRRLLFMHHLVLGGCRMTDHIDGDTLNCRKSNLRHVTNTQNSYNRRKGCRPESKTFTSEYKGVSLVKKNGKYKAQIMKDKKAIRLGEFETQIEAAMAYNKAAKELFGEFACPNKI